MVLLLDLLYLITTLLVRNNNTDYYIIIGISLVIVFIAFILWLLFGKDKPVIETVEFYPPEGYNSAELAFLYKGETDDKAIVSLLIYLASKGYLSIKETENKALFASTKDFTIYKLKEYDGTNEIENFSLMVYLEQDLLLHLQI